MQVRPAGIQTIFNGAFRQVAGASNTVIYDSTHPSFSDVVNLDFTNGFGLENAFHQKESFPDETIWYAYFLFARPYYKPYFVCGNLVNNTTTLIQPDFLPLGVRMNSTLTVYAMTTPWDPNTLTWNNQPGVPTGLPSVQIVYENGNSGIGGDASFRGQFALDCTQVEAPIVGAMATMEINFTASDNFSNDSTMPQCAFFLRDTGNYRTQIPIVSRSSTSHDPNFGTPNTRTITLASPHGFVSNGTAGWNSDLQVFSVYDCDTNYDTVNPYNGMKFGASIVRIPDDHTLTYYFPASASIAMNALDEATTTVDSGYVVVPPFQAP